MSNAKFKYFELLKPYLLSTFVVVLPFLLILATPGHIAAEIPFLFFFSAVLISGIYGGFAVGMYATFLSALVADFFFLPPTLTFFKDNWFQELKIFLYIADCTVISILSGKLKTSKLQARLEKAEREKGVSALEEKTAFLETMIEQMPMAVVFADAKTGEHLWKGLAAVSEEICINERLVQAVLIALRRTHDKAIAEHKNTINQHKQEVAAKELEEDKATDLLMSGVLDKDIYARTIKKIRGEKRHFVDLLEQSQMSITDKFYETSEQILELCIHAKTQWENTNVQEKLQFLEKVLSNQYLDGSTIRYDLKKPFARLAEMKKNEFGARESEVEEPNSSIISDLKRVEPVLCVELEAFPEAKLLRASDLKVLVKKHGSNVAAARFIGASEAFVRQKNSSTR